MPDQKVAIVTGAARRIGASIASLLHQAGWNVIIHYHTSQKEAEQLCSTFNAARPHSAIILQADLSVTDHIVPLIEQAYKAWGRLDVLVNNASCFYKTVVGEATEQQWDNLFANNVKAPFFLCQAATPYLREQQGCIVNITDVHSERPLRDYAIYCMSKAALVMMTKALAKELGPEIRVNAVAPGAIIWPEEENSLSMELKQQIMAATALQRGGEPLDIAKAVLYLIRDAGYTTGHILTVDGGRSLRM